jgi:hypothetical protein
MSVGCLCELTCVLLFAIFGHENRNKKHTAFLFRIENSFVFSLQFLTTAVCSSAPLVSVHFLM